MQILGINTYIINVTGGNAPRLILIWFDLIASIFFEDRLQVASLFAIISSLCSTCRIKSIASLGLFYPLIFLFSMFRKSVTGHNRWGKVFFAAHSQIRLPEEYCTGWNKMNFDIFFCLNIKTFDLKKFLKDLNCFCFVFSWRIVPVCTYRQTTMLSKEEIRTCSEFADAHCTEAVLIYRVSKKRSRFFGH